MSNPAAWRRGVRALAIALVVAAGAAGVAATLAAPGDGAGSLLAFGSNQYGQLGNATNSGTTTANPTPGSIVLPDAIGSASSFAAGGHHDLVVASSGEVYAFGDNYYGQLGHSTNTTTNNANPSPTLVTLPGQTGPAVQVEAGESHSLALTATGQVFAFGYNGDGQLGFAANATPNFIRSTVGLPGVTDTLTQIAAGGYHSLVATSSGQLYAFGFNFYGQLGNATNNGATTPNPTPTLVTLPGQVGTVAQLAGGTHYSLVLTSSGQLYAFGDNRYGQLGNPTNNGTTTANPTPTLVTLPGQSGSIIRIAAGADHSLVITSSGQLYAFGQNNYGQLGSPTNSGTATPNPTPAVVTLPGAVGPVTQVAAGAGSSLAVTASGQLYAFGRNEFGQLGSATNNGTNTPNPTPALVALPAGTTIDTVASDGQASHSLVIVSNLAILTAAIPAGQVGSAYQTTLYGAGGTNPLTWNVSGLPAGLTVAAARGFISGTPAAAGTFPLTAVVTDAYGSRVSAAFTLIVSAPGGPAVAKAPTLSRLKQTASKWKLGSKLARLVNVIPAPVKRKGVPVGSTFSFGVDQAALVTVTFRHTAQGRRVSGTCVAKTRGNAGKPRCTRTLTDGTLRVQARSGTNRLRFEGRVSASKKLKAGAYSVLLQARNSGGKASTTKTLRFTIAPG